VIAALLLATLVAAPSDAPGHSLVERPAPHLPEGGGRDGRIHLQLSADATYGIGGQSFLGSNLHLDAFRSIWDRRKVTGTIDFGAQFSYGNEPTWLAPWLANGTTTGATHRVQVVATLGHTFHIGQRRRFSLGTHLYGGWNHWRSAYAVNYPDEGINGEATVSRNHPLAGGQVELGYRFHRRVGVHMVLGGPFPTHSSYAITIFHVGLGLTVHLR
jgi:hypothetical protein